MNNINKKQFSYFKLIWDNRLNKPGHWLAIDAFKVNFNWFWFFTWTPENKTWFHCYIHTPLFYLSKNNCSTSFGLSFFKYQFGLTYHY
jgi:hypothetical protein